MINKGFSTEEFGKLVKSRPETIRRGFCVDGHYMGVRPIKLPNRRLIWPSEPVEKLLQMVSA